MICQFCGEERLVERVGSTWFCQVCGKTSKAYTQKDQQLLRKAKIADPEQIEVAR